jgi:SAM-dependent methyltransferase
MANALNNHPSVAVYTQRRLALYDALILRLSCRLLWHCPRSRLLELYDLHVGARHLDVGVGTGWFLDRCRFPVAEPQLTLLDLNDACLEKAARRLARYAPRTLHANLLEPLNLGKAEFDSIALNGVLHCLPATPDEKAAALARLRPHLAPGGVLFGSTIVGRGVHHSRLAERVLGLYNREQIFTNRDDDPDSLERALRRAYADVALETRGSFALFIARP